jgi:hypothetical protein
MLFRNFVSAPSEELRRMTSHYEGKEGKNEKSKQSHEISSTPDSLVASLKF